MLFERLAKTIGRHFESDNYDAGLAAAEAHGAPRSLRDIDDTLAFLARYLRQDWETLKELPMEQINRMLEAAMRLIRLENGKRETLDLQSASEENR